MIALRMAGMLPLLIAIAACGASQTSAPTDAAVPEAPFDLTHAHLDALLAEHVDDQGLVDYGALQADRAGLNSYLANVAAATREEFEAWESTDRLAFLINAYNAYTLQLVIDHWPIDSIRDTHALGNPWDHFEFPLLGARVTLNQIEHELIRSTFNEPRIHFALVCAAVSCPPLRRTAWRGETLDEDLESATRSFLSDDSMNDLSDPNHLRLSALFDWYGDEFAAASGSVAAYVDAHSELDIPASAEIDFLQYHWDLNAQVH